MAILRKKEIRDLAPAAIDAKMEELYIELNSERGIVASGGKAINAGRIRELRRTIARMLTIQKEKAAKPKEAKKEKAAKQQPKQEKV
jgi:large subunit ribosomal protein L29